MKRNTHMLTYADIKDLAKQIRATTGVKCQVTDLIALAAQNDPFYTGTEADTTNARWFADLWTRFGYSGNVHLRRIHYQIISQQTPVLLPDGSPYENTMRCWNFLELASKAARYLDYVPPTAFVDRRNPDPHLFLDNDRALPTIEVVNGMRWGGLELPDMPDLPSFALSGYRGAQKYHLEVWCEKSTMNDVLLPICQRYEANFVTGVGEQSITSTIDLIRRAIQSRKPVRVFYISDFDPAGRSMPVAVARKAEFYIQKLDPEIDFRLFPIVLTEEQCKTYCLPRTPIKDTEKRKDHFELAFGTGATELDALEALHPGALGDLLRAHILRYYDEDLRDRVYEERRRLCADLDEIRRSVASRHASELELLQAAYYEIQGEFRSRLEILRDNVSACWSAMMREMEDRLPSLADYPIPAAADARERDDSLFDSRREYLTQLNIYKHFQGKPNGFHALVTAQEDLI